MKQFRATFINGLSPRHYFLTAEDLFQATIKLHSLGVDGESIEAVEAYDPDERHDARQLCMKLGDVIERMERSNLQAVPA